MHRITFFSLLSASIFFSGILFGVDYHRVSLVGGSWGDTNAWNTVPAGTPIYEPGASDNAFLDDNGIAGTLWVDGETINNLTVSGTGWGFNSHIFGASFTVANAFTLNSSSSFVLGSLANVNVGALILNSGSLLRFDTDMLNITSGVLNVSSFHQGDDKIKIDLLNLAADFSGITEGESRTVIAAEFIFSQAGLGANDIFELVNAPSGYEFVFNEQGLALTIPIPEANMYAELFGVSILGFSFLRRRR